MLGRLEGMSAITKLELNVRLIRYRSRSDSNCGKGEGVVVSSS
jgi:hypothetical protein